MRIFRSLAGAAAAALLGLTAAACSNGPSPTPVAASSSAPTIVASVLVQASSAAASPSATTASPSATASASASATASASASASPSDVPMAASDPTLNAGDVSALCAKAEQAALGAYAPTDPAVKAVRMYFDTFCGAAASALAQTEGDTATTDVATIDVSRHNCFNDFSQLATHLKLADKNVYPSLGNETTYLAYSDTTGILTTGNANHVCGTDENSAAAPNSPIATYPGLG